MTIDGKIGSVNYNDERARANGHDPVILTGAVKAAQGELPVGLVLTRDANEDFIPYEEVASESIGTGNSSLTSFSDTLEKTPAEPGSVSVTDGVETFADDGFGTLTGVPMTALELSQAMPADWERSITAQEQYQSHSMPHLALWILQRLTLQQLTAFLMKALILPKPHQLHISRTDQ